MALVPKTMKVVDLQRELKVRGRKTTGLRKNQLVELLEKELADESNTTTPRAPPNSTISPLEPQGKPDQEEDSDDVDLGFLEANDAQSSESKTVESSSTQAKASTSTSANATTSSTYSSVTATQSNASSSSATSSNNTNSGSSIAVASSTTTTATALVDERRKRAQRFGLSLRQDKSQDAKETRKHRFGIVTELDKKEARAEKFGLLTEKKASELRKTRAERFAGSNGEGTVSKKAKRLEKFGLPTAATEEKIAKRKQRFGELKSDSLTTTNPHANPIRRGGRGRGQARGHTSRGSSNGHGGRGGRDGRGGRGGRGRRRGQY